MKTICNFERVSSVILSLCLLLPIIALMSCADYILEEEPEPNLFLALGDSVSSGYGLPYIEDWHTFMLYERLRENGYIYLEQHYLNKAVAGYTIYSEGEETKAGIGRRIVDGTLAAWGVLRDVVTDTFNTGHIILGLFTPEIEAALEGGVQSFADEFSKIITWIETSAPRATIIVNTVYNPIPS